MQRPALLSQLPPLAHRLWPRLPRQRALGLVVALVLLVHAWVLLGGLWLPLGRWPQHGGADSRHSILVIALHTQTRPGEPAPSALPLPETTAPESKQPTPTPADTPTPPGTPAPAQPAAQDASPGRPWGRLVDGSSATSEELGIFSSPVRPGGVPPETNAAEPAPPSPSDATVAQAGNAPPAEPTLPEPAAPPPRYPVKLPPALHLHYRVEFNTNFAGTGELLWWRQDQRYTLHQRWGAQVRTEVLYRSTGWLTDTGLQPERMVERRQGRDRFAVNFQRDKRLISYASVTHTAPWFANSQDRGSWLVQLAGVLAALERPPAAGDEFLLHVAGPRGTSELWPVKVGREVRAETPQGTVMTTHLSRAATHPYDTQIDLWVAPQLHWLPLRMRFQTLPGGEPVDWFLSDPIDHLPEPSGAP